MPGVSTYRVVQICGATSFHCEVARVARKELKPELQDIRKALSTNGSEIAAFRREIDTLASQIKLPQRPAKAAGTPPAAGEDVAPGKPRQTRFQPQALAKKRETLGISQKDMARLLGASLNSVVRWESGPKQPRAAAQLARIGEVLKMGKRQALDALMNPDAGVPAVRSKVAQRQIVVADVVQTPVRGTAPKEPRQTHFQTEVLRRKREALGIRRQDMAKLLDASLNSVIRWESGQMQPRAATQLARITQVLKMDKRQALDALGQM